MLIDLVFLLLLEGTAAQVSKLGRSIEGKGMEAASHVVRARVTFEV